MITPYSEILIPSGTSGTTNVTSSNLQIQFYLWGALQVVYSGSLNGTLNLMGSIDKVNWTVVNTVNVTMSGSTLWNMPNTGYFWFQVQWVYTSGSGNLYAIGSAKG